LFIQKAGRHDHAALRVSASTTTFLQISLQLISLALTRRQKGMFSPLLQGLPPIPDSGDMDLTRILINMMLAIAWAVVAGISFAIVIPLGIRLFNALTPGLDEIEELKKGNMAVALVFATFIISLTAIIVAILIK
jgi:hypothetical protein